MSNDETIAVTRLTCEEISELCGPEAIQIGRLKSGQKYNVQLTPQGYKIDNADGNRKQRRANESHRRKQRS